MTDTNTTNVAVEQERPQQRNSSIRGMSGRTVDVHEENVVNEIPAVVPLAAPAWKRWLDLALIILALPLLLPLMVFIGALIWAVSGWPILFRQERVGFLGKRFVCFKFRTMFMGNDAVMHQKHLAQLVASGRPMEKMDSAGDPRIIPFGRILRSSGLDELPQIINVIRGEMSLVGPRPCIPYEYEHYLAWQKERFNALPGLTGLWQVSGKNKTTFEQMIRLDIQYVKKVTVFGDLAILFKTGPVIVSQLFEMANRRRSKRAGERAMESDAAIAKAAMFRIPGI